MIVGYVHWHEGELQERIAPLTSAGVRVLGHWSSEAKAMFRDPIPDVLVISLDRLPSHGRAIADWFWEAKSRRIRPLIFCGGAEDKVAATRARFPGARYCGVDEVASLLGSSDLGTILAPSAGST